jgi:hypothetical protein
MHRLQLEGKDTYARGVTGYRFSMVYLANAAWIWKNYAQRGAGQILHEGRIWYMTPELDRSPLPTRTHYMPKDTALYIAQTDYLLS